MTTGETQEYGWQDCWVDWEVACDSGIDTSSISLQYLLSELNSMCEDGSSTPESPTISRDRAPQSTYWIDAVCINQMDSDRKGHCQTNGSDNSTCDINRESWIDFALRAAPAAAPFCGLCILGNLKVSWGDPFPSRYSNGNPLDESQITKKSPHRKWSSCHSTRTLISRSSESLQGTGRWLLDHGEYTQWLDRPSSFLWLRGDPGAGKSVLMSTVIHDLEKNRQAGELVVYYFANEYSRGVSAAKAILCSMLGKLLFRKPTRNSFAEVWPLLNDLIAAGSPLSATRMIRLLSEIRHKLRKHETLYLLLDGLDELTHSPQERELVLELIGHASRHDPNHQIKCFVSSRSTFFGETLPKDALRVDLDSHPLTRNDMSLYVQDNLHNYVFAYPSQDVEELAKQILNSPSGSFLVLRLLLQASQRTPSNTNGINKNFVVSLNDFGEIELATIYGAMLARIEDCNKEAALSMLRWVTFAARPLELHELLALYKETGIEIKEEDISTISAGLLISTGNQIRFTHFSVREYFQSQLRDKWEELSEEANEMIAHACLKLLSAESLLRSLNLSTRKVSSSKDAIASGFVPYAQTHWMFHYKRGERRSTYLAGLLHDILEQSLGVSKKIEHGMEENIYQNARGGIESSLTAEYRHNDFESLNLVNIALRVGARFGFTKLAKLELDMGANLNTPLGPEQQTPLCLAANGGHLEVAKLLLQRGADPNITSGSGLSPMVYALANGHFDIQDLLMQYTVEDPQRSNSHKGLDASNASQELLFTTVISPSCTSCRAYQVHYEICAVPGIIDEGKVLPPIMVSGETVSESELELYINLSDIREAGKLSTIVRWFPGVHMYRILKSVARRGIDDVKRLLLAAGNERNSLDTVNSVSKLFERSKI